MICRCRDLRAALIEAKAEVEAAIYKLSEDGFCSVKLGYKMREKWERLIMETADGYEKQAENSETGGAREPLEPH